MVKITIPKSKRKLDDSEPSESSKKSRSEPVVVDIAESPIEIIDDPDPPPQTEASKTNLRVQCPVCLDVPEVAVATECGHIYCYECVYPALCSTRNATKRMGECSVCRRKVSYKKVVGLQFKKSTVESSATPVDTH